MGRPKKGRHSGKAFEELLKQKGVTQYELAKRTGLSRGHISRIVSGEISEPKLETLEKIAEALGIDLGELVKLFTTQQADEPIGSLMPNSNFEEQQEVAASSSKRKPNNMECTDTQGFTLPEGLPPVKNWVPGSRSRELDTLKAQILHPQTRAITITAVCVVGLAGIGKTSLASQLVRQLHAENAPFVAAVWKFLGSSTGKPPRFDSTMDELLLTLSNGEITVAVTILDDYFKKTQRLLKLLRDKPCLVILDNVETVLKTNQAKRAGFFADDCGEYAWLFQQIVETEHQSKVIFTSRETLAQLQQREISILPLRGLDEKPAVDLLQSLLLNTDPEEIAKLVKRYNGHPKALELVANVIFGDEFQGDVGKFLEDREWLLVNTLDELIDQVIRRLSDEELECLSKISIYEMTEFDLSVEGIAAQMPAMSRRDLTENIIEALKRRHLLDYDKDRKSYQMHPLIQEKASSVLNSETRCIAHRQAYRYFLRIAKPESEWKDFKDVKPLLRVHYHACQGQDWDEAAAAISQTYDYLRQRGYSTMLIDLYKKLIPEKWQDEEQLVTSPHQHCEILYRLGLAYHSVGNFKTANQYLEHSLSTAKRLGDLKMTGSALCYMGLNQQVMGSYKIAIECLHKCLEIATDIKDNHLKYKALEYLGCIYNYTGKYHIGIKLLKQSLEVARQDGFVEGEALALGNVGSTYSKLGKCDLAIEYLKQYLELSNKIEFRRGQSLALFMLAETYNIIARYTDARDCANKSIKIAHEITDKDLENTARITLCISDRELGEYQAAIQGFEQCISFARSILAPRNEASAFYNLGIVYRKLGEIDLSIESLQSSIKIYRQNGERADEARVLVELAKTSFKTDSVSVETIQCYLNQTEQICRELQLLLPELAEAYYQQGATYKKMGDSQKSQDNFDKAIKLFEEMEAPKQVEKVQQAMQAGR